MFAQSVSQPADSRLPLIQANTFRRGQTSALASLPSLSFALQAHEMVEASTTKKSPRNPLLGVLLLRPPTIRRPKIALFSLARSLTGSGIIRRPVSFGGRARQADREAARKRENFEQSLPAQQEAAAAAPGKLRISDEFRYIHNAKRRCRVIGISGASRPLAGNKFGP